MPKRATAPSAGWRVQSQSYPSGHGCYSGRSMSRTEMELLTTTTEHGVFATKEEAIAKARLVRESECAFEGWAEEHYGDAEPPYDSIDGENYDDDETVSISIVDVSRERAQAAAALKKARASKPRTAPRGVASGGASAGAAVGVFGEVQGARPPVDVDRFARNPAHVAGGKVVPASCYPGSGRDSFAYLLQCLSDHNYAMRAFCLEGYPHARYVTYKPKRALRRSCTWLAPADSTLDAHGKDRKIMDTCHLEFTGHKDGGCLLTGSNLLAAVDETTECIFINNFTDQMCRSAGRGDADVAAVAAAIVKCKESLRCISFVESKISASIVDALAECRRLRGLLFTQVENGARPGAGGHAPTSAEGVAAVLRANPELKWLHVDDGHFGGPAMFGAPCWEALREGACPGLEVLWVEMRDAAPPGVVREALTAPGSALAKSLNVCMVNPDTKLASAFDLRGGSGGTSGAKKLTVAQRKKAGRLQG